MRSDDILQSDGKLINKNTKLEKLIEGSAQYPRFHPNKETIIYSAYRVVGGWNIYQLNNVIKQDIKKIVPFEIPLLRST